MKKFIKDKIKRLKKLAKSYSAPPGEKPKDFRNEIARLEADSSKLRKKLIK